MPKEIVIPAPSTFELADYHDAPLGDNEIRGRTVCSLISQGTELAWANGEDFPVRPGYAAVFRVEEIGRGVDGVNPGDLRFCMGHHRETQQWQARFTLPLPDGMAAETAVLARLMGVSMTTLMTTAARPGDRVVIAGAGPVGLLAAHLFAIGGYDVSVVEPDSLRRSQAEISGIARTFSQMPLDDPEMKGSVALVVDCSGHEAAVLDGCRIVRKSGEVVLVGVPWRPRTDLAAHDLLNAVFFNFVHLRSGWEWELPVLSREFVWEELYDGYNNAPYSTFTGLARALKWLSEDRIPLEGLVYRTGPQNPPAVYRALINRRIEQPFVVLDWTALDRC